MEDGATEMLQMLIAFVGKYPEYNKRKFIISGESYAGKYLPHLARKILDYNQNEKKKPADQ